MVCGTFPQILACEEKALHTGDSACLVVTQVLAWKANGPRFKSAAVHHSLQGKVKDYGQCLVTLPSQSQMIHMAAHQHSVSLPPPPGISVPISASTETTQC